MGAAEVEFGHRSTALTVAELRAVLDGAPNDAPVLIFTPEDAREVSFIQLNASSAEKRVHPQFGPQVVISASAVSGRYRRPAQGRLRVTVSESGAQSASATERVRDALSSVAVKVGHRGESEIDTSQPGQVIATWQAANVPLPELLQWASRAVHDVDPDAVLVLEDETDL